MSDMKSPIALITGVCGFIGSCMAKNLTKVGYEVYGLDKTYRSDRFSTVNFVDLDLTSKQAVEILTQILKSIKPDVVMHLAALIQVGQGEREPELYQLNNVGGTRNVLDAMRNAGIKKLIFSSTAAVYKPLDLDILDLDILKEIS